MMRYLEMRRNGGVFPYGEEQQKGAEKDAGSVSATAAKEDRKQRDERELTEV